MIHISSFDMVCDLVLGEIELSKKRLLLMQVEGGKLVLSKQYMHLFLLLTIVDPEKQPV